MVIRENLRQLIQETVDSKMIPGMVWGIIDGSFQLRDEVGETYPVYDLASITKLFIATRILQLIEDGKFELGTPVQDILPEFKNGEITIEHLLLHRSGFAASMSGRYTMKYPKLRQSLYDGLDLENDVDTVMVYSCINFLLLGEVIEILDGSLEKGIQEGILNPLEMTETGFNPSNKEDCAPTWIDDERGVIQGVVHDRTAYAWGGIAGNAGLFSTLDDMFKFAKGFLDQTILTHESITLLMDTKVDMRSLGWNLYKDDYLYHTGYTGPSILLDIENHRALILLTNRNYPKQNDAYLQRRLELFDIFLTR